jgi:hypothetical protein
MSNITGIGIDLAENVFQLFLTDKRGRVIKNIKRKKYSQNKGGVISGTTAVMRSLILNMLQTDCSATWCVILL